MQCDFAVQVAAQWDFRRVVQILNWLSVVFARNRAQVTQASTPAWNDAHLPLERGILQTNLCEQKFALFPMRTTEMCSASLDVPMGRSFPYIKLNLSSDSTNPSKSSSVCCHLPMQTWQILTNPSFNIPRLLGTPCPSAEWVGDLLDIKSKYVLSKNQFQFFLLPTQLQNLSELHSFMLCFSPLSEKFYSNFSAIIQSYVILWQKH